MLRFEVIWIVFAEGMAPQDTRKQCVQLTC